jgi:bifunctional non-homologous end joining protein LigD
MAGGGSLKRLTWKPSSPTCLQSESDDLRKLSLNMRKVSLARFLARRINGIFLSDYERGEIGPDLFRHACMLGLEGLVSKRNNRAYRAGVPPNWVKIENPDHPAMLRVKEAFR